MSNELLPSRNEAARPELQALASALERAAWALQSAAREAERAALVVESPVAALPAQTDRLLTVTEAAQILSISRSKLYELVLAGDIPSITLGRSRRIPAAALTAWIAHQHSEGPALVRPADASDRHRVRRR